MKCPNTSCEGEAVKKKTEKIPMPPLEGLVWYTYSCASCGCGMTREEPVADGSRIVMSGR